MVGEKNLANKKEKKDVYHKIILGCLTNSIKNGILILKGEFILSLGDTDPLLSLVFNLFEQS